MKEYIIKKIDMDDEDMFNEFIFEHLVNDEEKLVCDNSLITNKTYIKYRSFNEWYQTNKMIEEFDYSNEKVKALTYLLYQKNEKSKRLLSVIEIRLNLTNNTLIHGNISINIRPSERSKGYYSKSLRCALELSKELNMDKVMIVVSKDDIKSKSTIEKNFKDFSLEEDNNIYTYTFYNKRVKDINDFDSDTLEDDVVYAYSEKLFYNEIDNGINTCEGINDAINSLFNTPIPFGYIYVLNKDNDSNIPRDVIKVTYEEYLEFKNSQKAYKKVLGD